MPHATRQRWRRAIRELELGGMLELIPVQALAAVGATPVEG